MSMTNKQKALDLIKTTSGLFPNFSIKFRILLTISVTTSARLEIENN